MFDATNTILADDPHHFLQSLPCYSFKTLLWLNLHCRWLTPRFGRAKENIAVAEGIILAR